jgi:hypothetical protein
MWRATPILIPECLYLLPADSDARLAVRPPIRFDWAASTAQCMNARIKPAPEWIHSPKEINRP